MKKVHAKPYGFVAPNGLNFGRSVNTPNSRLAAVLYALANWPGMTRRDILENVFGQNPARPGWGSMFFAGLVKSEFVYRSNTHRYYITNKGYDVLFNLGLL